MDITGSNEGMENKQLFWKQQQQTNSYYCKIFTATNHIKNESVVPTKILQAIICSTTITTNWATISNNNVRGIHAYIDNKYRYVPNYH